MWRQAIGDFKDILKAGDYRIDMDDWFNTHNGVCHVCMAGACMFLRIKDPLEYVCPGMLDSNTENNMYSINEMRQGNFDRAASYLNVLFEEQCLWEEAFSLIKKKLPLKAIEDCNLREDWHGLCENLLAAIDMIEAKYISISK